LTKDARIVEQARAALRSPRYTGERLAADARAGRRAAFERAFPAYGAFEAGSPDEFLNEDAATILTDEDTSDTPVTGSGTITVLGSLPVPAGLPAGPWHVALAVAPAETLNYCPRGGRAVLDGAASHAEALVLRPSARAAGWEQRAGTLVAAAPPGTALAPRRPVAVYVDRVTVRSGDLLDVWGTAEVRDTARSPATLSPVLTLTACLWLDGTPIDPCATQDVANEQLPGLTFAVARTGLLRVPAGFGSAPRRVRVTMTVSASAAGLPNPAALDGLGNFDVQVYRPPG
jgi:hypothetical protein